MKDPILEKSLTSAKPVISVLEQQGICVGMKDPILEKSLTSAKPVASGLAQLEA